MAERERETIVTTDGGGGGGTIVAVVLLLIAVIVAGASWNIGEHQHDDRSHGSCSP